MANPTRAKLILPPTRDPLRPNMIPSTQGLIRPRFSGRALTPFEVDYSEMEILSHRREVGADGNVKYFVFRLRLSEPDSEPQEFFKAVRLIRLTRIPRYLRQAGKDPSAVFDQQRDLLAALRQEDVLFLNLIAKAPEIPMVFSYGVQAVGTTEEEAKAMADRAYAVLSGQLDGTYQQLEYQPLSPFEAEHLVRYQTEWSHIAAARGQPVASGSALSMGGGVLGGNRTDGESAANQLEAFLRGMDDHSFMVTTIMAPVSPAEITRTWRNLTGRLSDIRSDTDGARAVTAGIAVPVGMGLGLGENHGQSHSVAEAQTVGEAFTTSESISTSESVTDTVSHTQGAAASETVGTTQAVTDTVASTEGVTDTLAVAHSASQGASASTGVSEGVSLSESVSQGETLSQSATQSQSVGVGQTLTEGQSISEQMSSTVGQASSVGVSQSHSQSASASLSDSHSVNQGASSSLSESLGANWSESFQEAISAQQSRAENWQQNFQESLASQFGISEGNSSSSSKGESIAKGSSMGAPGGIAGKNETLSDVWSRVFGDSHEVSSSVSNTTSQGASVGGSSTGSVGSSLTTGASTGGSSSQTATQGVNVGETVGQTATQSIGQTATQGVTQSEAISQSQSQSVGVGQSVSQSQSLSQSQGMSQGVGLAESITATEGIARSAQASQAQGATQSVSQTGSQAQAVSRGLSQAQSLSQGSSQASTVSQSVANSVGRSAGVTQGASAGVSQTASAGQGLTDAYLLSMGRSAQHSSSLGLVPSVGISISRQTHDVQKKRLGDILDAQVRRLDEARIGGAYLYQMFVQAADAETLHRASGLLKSAFWGSDDASRQWHAFHVVNPEALKDDRQRIHDHVRAFSHYRRREPNAELIEPHVFSTFITPGEAAQLTHPPVTESAGILAVHDSMPVFARPFDRQNRDIDLGYVVNGERGKPSDVHFGLDPDELEHTLLAGATGSGKSTTLMKMMSEVSQVSRTITLPRDPNNPLAPPQEKTIYAGALCLDWQTNLRSLADVVPAERFRFYSIAEPSLGWFRWNPLAIPTSGISPSEWVDTLADQFMIAYGLGEYGRSIIQEHIDELYRANRLEPYVLMEPKHNPTTGAISAAGIRLDPVDRDALPDSAIDVAPDGTEVANVYTCPDLSRLISMADLAVLIRAKMEELSTPEAGRLYGTEIRNRYQTIWRRLQYFAPGGAGERIFGKDVALDEMHCLTVPELVDPDRGLFTVIEVDGLDRMHRKFILGSVLLAVWRYGQSHGKGVFNHNGTGPGTFVCMEEAHELFGSQEEGEDSATADRRTAIYESLFRRARTLGLKLIAVVQNPADIPAAIHSNTSTAVIHRLSDERDRRVVAGLMNWNIQFDHRREVRYLGEMPKGWCLVRLEPKDHFLQAAPVHVQVDPPALRDLSADELRQILSRG